MPGITVTVYASQGGTQLATGMTDATGSVTLSWQGSDGTYYWTTTGGPTGYQPSGQSQALTSGGSASVALSAATGYHCAGCMAPIGGTVQATIGDSGDMSGTATLTWAGSGWQGNYTNGAGHAATATLSQASLSLTVQDLVTLNACTLLGDPVHCNPWMMTYPDPGFTCFLVSGVSTITE